MASMLIERKAGEFDPKEFHNRYVDALHRLIEKKQKAKGEKIIEEPEEASGQGLERHRPDGRVEEEPRRPEGSGKAKKPAAKKARGKEGART